ncbi:MAG: hypothetical protein N3D10_03430 [Candidatus Micrarchaeota archaeon]|nr:hypothetical protein [Candidatus Micrarchaeota archaeon]
MFFKQKIARVFKKVEKKQGFCTKKIFQKKLPYFDGAKQKNDFRSEKSILQNNQDLEQIEKNKQEIELISKKIKELKKQLRKKQNSSLELKNSISNLENLRLNLLKTNLALVEKNFFKSQLPIKIEKPKLIFSLSLLGVGNLLAFVGVFSSSFSFIEKVLLISLNVFANAMFVKFFALEKKDNNKLGEK